jgi:nucleoside-diphosphate-sugar epimerase
MRVFVTGATGFIGSTVVKELIAAGHQVLGLCRSKEKEAALAAAGADVYRGSIAEPDSLKQGASQSDGVIHLAFNHDFSKFVQNCEDDRRVIEALGSALSGSGRPLIVTSGTPIANTVPGEPAKEDNAIVGSNLHPSCGLGGSGCLRSCERGERDRRQTPASSQPGRAGSHYPSDRDVPRKGRVHLCRRRP